MKKEVTVIFGRDAVDKYEATNEIPSDVKAGDLVDDYVFSSQEVFDAYCKGVEDCYGQEAYKIVEKGERKSLLTPGDKFFLCPLEIPDDASIAVLSSAWLYSQNNVLGWDIEIHGIESIAEMVNYNDVPFHDQRLFPARENKIDFYSHRYVVVSDDQCLEIDADLDEDQIRFAIFYYNQFLWQTYGSKGRQQPDDIDLELLSKACEMV